jgi:predicted NAD/FAD-binding protein
MTKPTKTIAVVGSGIAGLSAAWLLRQRYEVTLFEKNDYLGGHTHTLEVEEAGRSLAIDTGFIVYNEPNYPHLTRLLHHLGVDSQDTDMSFGVSVAEGALEYAGDNLSTLFAQPRNLLKREFLGMLKDILRFNAHCKRLLRQNGFADIGLGAFLDRHGYGDNFRHHYLLPMAASIWSCPSSSMLTFPAASFVRFLHNHGLLNLTHRPQWKTVKGGSWSYVKKLSSDLQHSTRIDTAVVGVKRHSQGVQITLADGHRQDFDKVVMACHADDALALLQNPSELEVYLLSRFRYQANRAWLHTDTDLMPRSRKVWSAWNYLASEDADDRSVSVTYWMNRLQRLEARHDYLVSLNPLKMPREEQIIAHMTYQHPLFDQQAIAAQQDLQRIQGRDRIWFCGSYFGYGFHEDALDSSVQVARSLGVAIPWLASTQAQQDQQAAAPASSLAGALS